ncbi:PD-(D/E)XK nuclease family protein [Spirosoma endophyticum]|uniref:PD-(D/E)XK nuclease superfamily protein n=1 Tax=Spirosoma endophyticum TaxID=662367 RepID=A0A1I2BA73_9BACT|nr:PD-(D/E)XK nuclease family protein [Spirosoma endophyticum]SFE53092.1 PD-(D/E)XK nuclease superfamily protein [Spirosoma endophyticum]
MFTHTGYKLFQRCELQWYLKHIVADGRVKNDSFRREVTILSKLDTVEAWRGKIVDEVVSRQLVNTINRKHPIDRAYLLKEADQLFDSQLEYAAFQKYREPGRKFTDKDFAALINYEFGLDYSEEILDSARNDIHFALNNLLDDTEFITYLQSATFLASQRSLHYQFSGLPVSSKPDLIVFFADRPPHIIDWKVHTYGIHTYDEQLIAYAVALYKVATTQPHSYFPANLGTYSIYDYRLTEYQLLHPERIRRDYEVTKDRLEELNDKMSKGIIDMYMKGCHKKYGEVDPENFETTYYVENCHTCSLKTICKSKDYAKIPASY